MRGLDPCSHILDACPDSGDSRLRHSTTKPVSRAKQRFSPTSLAVDLHAAIRSRQQMAGTSRGDFFCGKVARIRYAAASVRLLTVPQPTAIQNVAAWMDAGQPPAASGAEHPMLFRGDVAPREMLGRISGSSGNGSLSRDKFTDSLATRRVAL